ncbi:reductase [Pseudoxanthomonas yeongjuensis]|uniref:dihydrofolate reductase family protein n=1 Tax=Pseudoxanthomonas yeongjuensis TaxID=377616 RepID=UPI001390AF7E|nr:dihydrofolate reductase family protein [Pseudoxanthomonas yeongjuensis]KAF1717388.1 reductase [Pseudoxanthomonas yeongjuensis]
MGKVIVEQIVSADGYAAYKDGGIGFFDASGDFREGEDEQMKRLRSVGAIVFGATTYRMFADYWPGADEKVERVAGPINSLPKFVVSNTLRSAPWGEKDEVEILRGDGIESVRRLRQRIDGDLMIWGSLTLTDALFRARQVDVLRLRMIAMLLGEGRSFAPDGLGDLKLALQSVRAYPSGHIVMQYSA